VLDYAASKVALGARLCENNQEPTRQRIVFSIALLSIATTTVFLFKLMKSRRSFYAQTECLRFHTASGRRRCSATRIERRLWSEADGLGGAFSGDACRGA
jgi:hypothetical protein